MTVDRELFNLVYFALSVFLDRKSEEWGFENGVLNLMLFKRIVWKCSRIEKARKLSRKDLSSFEFRSWL